jgi:hypothetical protein
LTFNKRNLSGRRRIGQKWVTYRGEGTIKSSGYFSLHKLNINK